MTTETEIVEGELLPAVIEPAAPITLFGTSDPKLALERMALIARALADVIEREKLYKNISGNRHITVEGWLTLGGMTGVVPVVEWTRPLEDGTGWEARAEARTVDGRVVGAGESMCTRTESNWRRADEHALRAMAQTRAIGRALQGPLRQIVVLAKYAGAGAEEMAADEAAPRQDARPRGGGPIPDEVKPTDDQARELKALVRSLEKLDPHTDWWAECSRITGTPWNHTTRTMAGRLIEKLKAELARLADAEEAA